MTDATVIVAAWRAQDTLERAIESACAQKSIDVEVIVVDDASPDGTYDLARTLAGQDPRVRALRLDTNGGPSAARNAAIAQARGRWIAVLDADDAFEPDRLGRMIKLGDAKGADAIYDDFQPVEPDGVPIGETHLASLGLDTPESWDLERFLAGCQAEPGRPSLGFLKPVFRRGFLAEHGLEYDPSLRNGEDFHLMAKLLVHGGALWVTPDAGYLYTVGQKGSISNRLNPDHASALAAADRDFLARYAERLGARARDLMRRRMRRLGDLDTAETVLNAVKRGQPISAAAALLARPRALGRLLRQAMEAVLRRLGQHQS